MGDRDHGVVRAGVLPHDVVGQPGHPFDVEVVGRLVEQEQVGRGHEQRGEGHPSPLSAGQRPDEGVHAPDDRGVEPAEQADEHVAHSRVGGPLVLGDLADHGLVDGRAGVEPVVLGQHPDREAADPRDPPGVDVPGAGEHPQERGLAATVAADDADAVAAADPERDGIEHLGGAERQGGALDRDEVGH